MKAQYDLFHHNSAMRKQDPNCELFYVKAKPQFITTFKMAQMQWKIEKYVVIFLIERWQTSSIKF